MRRKKNRDFGSRSAFSAVLSRCIRRLRWQFQRDGVWDVAGKPAICREKGEFRGERGFADWRAEKKGNVETTMMRASSRLSRGGLRSFPSLPTLLVFPLFPLFPLFPPLVVEERLREEGEGKSRSKRSCEVESSQFSVSSLSSRSSGSHSKASRSSWRLSLYCE